MTDNRDPEPRGFTEQLEVAGEHLIERIKALIAEGNVRRLRIISPDESVIVEVPLTIGAAAGGMITLAAPALAVVGAIAALIAKVRIDVVRDTPPGGDAS